MGNSLFKFCFGGTGGATSSSSVYQPGTTSDNSRTHSNRSSAGYQHNYWLSSLGQQSDCSSTVSARPRLQNRNNPYTNGYQYASTLATTRTGNGNTYLSKQTQYPYPGTIRNLSQNHLPATTSTVSTQNHNGKNLVRKPPTSLTINNQNPWSTSVAVGTINRNTNIRTTTVSNNKPRLLVKTGSSVIARPKLTSNYANISTSSSSTVNKLNPLASHPTRHLQNKRLNKPGTRIYSVKKNTNNATTVYHNDNDNNQHKRTTYNAAVDNLSIISSVPSNNLKNWLNYSLIITPFTQEHEYKIITEYVNNGQAHSYGVEILSIIKICQRSVVEFRNRDGFDPKAKRMMLWHGTKKKNVPSILEDGLRLPNAGYALLMQGRGIYFADRVTKSANYSAECSCISQIHSCNSEGVLLLCDVLLGRTTTLPQPNHNLTCAPAGFDSVKCPGKFIPIHTENHRLYGSCVPKGKTVTNAHHPNNLLQFNEYTVYDPDRINIKFIVHFRFNSSFYKNV